LVVFRIQIEINAGWSAIDSRIWLVGSDHDQIRHGGAIALLAEYL
jgi:hypothetical protein